MEDRSIIKPILDSLEYFNNSKDEIKYFYNIIDKFSAAWFNKNVNVTAFSTSELALIHDLLGEYIRFEENNKRIALWLLAINRVCYNYTADLTEPLEQFNNQVKTNNENFDTSLIEPILSQLRMLDILHKDAGKNNLGQSDIISNFLQWVMVYTTIIYPSLENKLDFYDHKILKAMNFILLEFIKQRSNDKRMAYLIMAIIEACKNFSLQIDKDCSNFVNTFETDSETIVPGQEETLIKELLEKLKDQTISQRDIVDAKDTIESYVKNSYDYFIDSITAEPSKLTASFNALINDFTNKVINLENDKKITFFKTLYRYRSQSKSNFNSDMVQSLKKSISALPEKTKSWIDSKISGFDTNKDQYITNIIQYETDDEKSRLNFIKPYIMIFLINKLELYK